MNGGAPAPFLRQSLPPALAAAARKGNSSLTTRQGAGRIDTPELERSRMPINCICPKCRKPLSIDDKYAGQPMKCPMCASMFQAPSLAAVAAQGGDPFMQPAGAGYDG